MHLCSGRVNQRRVEEPAASDSPLRADKGFPSRGKECPSRESVGRAVFVRMIKISKPTDGRLGGAMSRLTRFMERNKVLCGILCVGILWSPVQSLGATLTGIYSVTLAWDGSTSPEVTGYRVYVGETSGVYSSSIDVGNVTTVTITGLSNGIPYFSSTTAVDAFGQESPGSNEIRFVLGIPTVQMSMALNGQVSLKVSGQIGHSYYIQASENLTTWTTIGVVTLGSSASFDFMDVNAANFLKRFYRTFDPSP
jgi:hypothetical protein